MFLSNTRKEGELVTDKEYVNLLLNAFKTVVEKTFQSQNGGINNESG